MTTTTVLVIRQVDVHDDVAMRTFYDLLTRAELHGREDAPHWSWQEFAGTMRRPDPGQVIELHAGWVDGRMAATGNVFFSDNDNVEKAQVGATVDPDQRREGYGRRMLDHVCDRATGHGRTTLIGSARLPFDQLRTHPHRLFAEACGFSVFNAEVTRHLALPVDGATIASWTAADAARTAGYRVETFVDHVPDELLGSLCALQNQLVVDAPTGDVEYEEESTTPEQMVESTAGLLAQGRTVLHTLAIAGPDAGPDVGIVTAYSTIMVPPSPRTDASQWGTFVHREHRGHRLGMAVKAANLAELQRRFPAMRRVVTMNAETNSWMIAVNEQMGFDPVEVTVELVRRYPVADEVAAP